MNPLLKLGQDRFHNTIDIVVDVRICEADNLIAANLQLTCALVIMIDFGSGWVCRPIHLDH